MKKLGVKILKWKNGKQIYDQGSLNVFHLAFPPPFLKNSFPGLFFKMYPLGPGTNRVKSSDCV